MKVIASTAIVTTLPCARSTAAMPPAWSIWLITQPPKMSPLALVSAGMAMRRTVSSPCGWSEESSDKAATPLRRPCLSPRRRRRQAGFASDHPLDPHQIAPPRIDAQSRARQDRGDLVALPGPDLQEKPPVRRDQPRDLGRQRPVG